MFNNITLEKNWDSLMDTVEIIESIDSQKYGKFDVTVVRNHCLIQSTRRAKSSAYSKSYYSEFGKLEAVYGACSMFIEWYNNNLNNGKS